MRKSFIVAALALATIPMNGAMAAMDVATFLAKANRLKAKGPFALISGDFKTLTREVTDASKSLKEERLALQSAGKPTAWCPPQKASMDSNEIMAAMEAIPLAQRRSTDVRTALRGLMIRKFPCPAR